MLVFGTRPEAIKMAPLVKAFEKHPQDFNTLVCVTGQHREMLDQVLHLFDIAPDYDLNIMKQGQDLYDVTARVLVGMRDVLKEAKPDVVLVHGDTTTSTAAALAAFYQQIPVGHIEAGLRTHDIYSPWPEEMNRQITGRIATYHFAPTPLAQENLLKENILSQNITVTGNTVIDALYAVVEKIQQDQSLSGELTERLQAAGYDPLRTGQGRRIVLITGHRRENFGEGFRNICRAIKTLSKKYPEVDFVYPQPECPPTHRRGVRPATRSEPLLHRTARIPGIRLPDGKKQLGTHRQRGHPGRSSRPGKTGAGHARYDRTSGSPHRGDGTPGRYGLRPHHKRGVPSAGRQGLLRIHEPGGQSLRRWFGLRTDRGSSAMILTPIT